MLGIFQERSEIFRKFLAHNVLVFTCKTFEDGLCRAHPSEGHEGLALAADGILVKRVEEQAAVG